MSRVMPIGAAALLLSAGGLSLGAQGTTSLSVSGPPGSMIITTAIAGNEPTNIVGVGTMYTVTVKPTDGNKKIVGQLTAPMPASTTLTIELGVVTASVSMGPVALGTVARDLVINVAKVNNKSAAITYTFAATVSAGVIPSQTRTVIFTLLDYP